MTDHDTRPVLLIDGANMFIRCYCASPQMSAHGYQMGGCIGFLRTLRKLVNEIKPIGVYVCWEAGGSQRRRALWKEYKLGKKPQNLNRFYEDDIPDTEDNRKHQLVTLLGMLKNSPVSQVYVQDCEGDDIIAYMCTGVFRNHDKIIVSSDKDFYQLLNPKTKLYSLHKKSFVTHETVLEDFRVQADKFAIAKALCGDPGDNVPGVKGLGFKKVSVLFPFLGTDATDVILDTVFDFCSSHIEEKRMYRVIRESEQDIRRNYRLVHLDGSMLAPYQQAVVDAAIKSYAPKSNKMEIIKLLVREGIGDFDVDSFLRSFDGIEGVSFTEESDKEPTDDDS